MSVQVSINSAMTVVETITTGDPFGSAASITHDGMNERFTLNAGSTPAATKDAVIQQALTAGAATIDLTNMVGAGANGTTVNATGLKVRAFKFRNPGTNANDITLTFGASNGYLLLGTGWKITLKPGQSTGPFYLADGAPAIDATHKNIDLTGTGTQALDVMLTFG